MIPNPVDVLLAISPTVGLLLAGRSSIGLLSLILKKRIYTNEVDRTVLGVALWMSVLVIPSLVLGMFTSAMNMYYLIFSFLTFLLSICQVSEMLKNVGAQKWRSSGAFSKPDLIAKGIVAVGSVIVFSFTLVYALYRPVGYNQDAFSMYLPDALSILTTGSINYSAFFQTNIIMTTPPLVPILYGWILSVHYDVISLVFVSLLFYGLIALSSMELARSLLRHGKLPWLAPLFTLSVPALTLTEAFNGLYLDIPLLFSFSVLAIALSSDEHNTLWLLVSIMLASLTKEIGLIFAGFVIVRLWEPRGTLSQALSAILIASPFLVFLVAEIDRSWNIILGRFIVIASLVIVVFLILRRRKTFVTTALPLSQSLLIVSLALSPAIYFYSKNLITTGFLTPNFPLLAKDDLRSVQYSEVMYAVSFVNQTEQKIEVADYLKQWEFFLSPILGAFFFPLPLLGLLLLVSDGLTAREDSSRLMLIMILILVSAISILFASPNAPYSDRQLSLLAPEISILSLLGANFYLEWLDFPDESETLFVLSLCVMAAFYIFWIGSRVYSFFWHVYPIDPSQSIVLFALLWLVGPLIGKSAYLATRTNHEVARMRAAMPAALLCLLSLFLCLSPLCKLASEGLQKYGLDFNLPNTFPSEEDAYYDVSGFFQSATTNSTVLGFDDFFLVWANRIRVVDVSSPYGLLTLKEGLRLNDEKDIINFFLTHNIRYFLVPRQSISSFSGAFYRYLEASKRFALFRILSTSPSIISRASFDYYVLYELVPDGATAAFQVFNADTFSTNHLKLWDVVYGAPSIQNGSLFLPDIGNKMRLPTYFHDFNLTATFSIEGGMDWRQFNIFLWKQQTPLYFTISVVGGSFNRIEYRKIVDDAVLTAAFTPTPRSIIDSTPMVLCVERYNTTLFVKLGNETILLITDADLYGSMQIGIGTTGASSKIRSLRIISLKK